MAPHTLKLPRARAARVRRTSDDVAPQPRRPRRVHAAALLPAGVFVLAAAWRLAWQNRLAHSVFGGSLDADARVYWSWSGHILRNGPVPPAPLFLAPLYPYALALWRACGAGMTGVLVIQALLGSCAAALLADAARRRAGTGAALAVGVLLALGQFPTFFDGLVLPESLLFCLESLLVWFVARTDWACARAPAFAGYGALVGVLAQGRASEALLVVLALPLARARPQRAWRRFAIAGAALVVGALPSLIANARTAHEWIPYTYNLGYNLYVGNHAGARGGWEDVLAGTRGAPLPGTSAVTGGALDGRAYVLAHDGVRLRAGESSAWWGRHALDHVRHAPLATLALAGRKLLLEWNRRDTPQIESLPSFARAAGPPGLPWAGSFGLLAWLGLAGLPWALRRGAAERWCAASVALGALALLPVFVTDRYRLHLLPGLAVVAAVGLASLAQALRARRVRARTLLPFAAAGALVLAPLGPRAAGGEAWTFAADEALRWQERGDPARAEAAFARAETALPAADPAALSPSARADLAAFELHHGIALAALGREADATARWERAAALAPDDAQPLARLELAYTRAGRGADAARIRRRLAMVPGGRALQLVNDGWDAAEHGRLDVAEQHFVAATQLDPSLSLAWEGVIRIRIQTNRLESASAALDSTRDAGIDPGVAAIYAAFFAAKRGDLTGARRLVAGLTPGTESRDPVLARLLAWTREAIGAGR